MSAPNNSNLSASLQEKLAALKAQKAATVVTPTTPAVIAAQVPQDVVEAAATKAVEKAAALATSESSINVFEVREKIAALQSALLAAHPSMPVLLRTIHKQLREDPELVTTLTDEEVGIIANGLKRQTNTEIATTTVKQSSNSASLKKKINSAGGSAVDLF